MTIEEKLKEIRRVIADADHYLQDRARIKAELRRF